MELERKKIWLLRACSFAQVCATGLFSVFETVYMQENGISASWIGIIMGVTNGLFIFTGPMWGRIADKTNRYKRILILGTIGLSLTLVWFAWSKSITDFMIYAVLRGTFFSAILGIMPALGMANLRATGKGKGYGRYRSFGSLGFIAVSAVFPVLFGNIKTMAYFSALVLPLSIWALRKLDDPPKHKEQTHTRWHQMPRDFYIFMIASFFSFLTEPGVNGFFSAYAKSQGASLQLVGVLSGMTGFIAMVSLSPMGKWVDSRGVKIVLFISFFSQSLRMLITSLIHVPEFLWIPHLLHVFGWAGKEVATMVFLTNLVGERRQAIALSLFASLRMSGMMVGSLIMGYLADAYNYALMFQVIAGLSFIGFLMLFKIKSFEHSI